MFKNYIVVIAIVVCFVGYNAVEGSPVVQVNDCAKKFPIDPTLGAYFNSVRPTNNTRQFDENTKCYMNCMYKSIGLVNEDGKITPETIANVGQYMFGENEERIKKTNELFTLCSAASNIETSVGDVRCERALQIYKCVVKNIETVGLKLHYY